MGVTLGERKAVDLRLGTVYNFGAGDLIELEGIPGVNGMRLISFTKETVPAVNITAGNITVRRDAVDLSEDGENPSR